MKERYIKYHWISDDPNLISKAEELAELRRATQSRKSKRPFEEAFNVILTAFEVLGVYSGFELRIPRDNNLYNAKSQRNPAYTTDVRDALIFLIDEGFIDKTEDRKSITLNHKLFWLPNRYNITTKWLEQIASQPLSVPSLIRRNPLMPYTELRKDVWKESNTGKKEKTKVAIPISTKLHSQHKPMLERTDRILRDYDALMRQTKVTLGDETIHSGLLSLTRIFS